MHNPFKKTPTPLDIAIENGIERMCDLDLSQEDYTTTVDHLVKLHTIKETHSRRVSPDTMILVAANLIGLVMVTHRETTDIITSKALGLILKPR